MAIVDKVKSVGAVDPKQAKKDVQSISEFNKKQRLLTEQEIYKLRSKYDKQLAKADEKDKKKLQDKLRKEESSLRHKEEQQVAAYKLNLANQNELALKKERQAADKEYWANRFANANKLNKVLSANGKSLGENMSAALHKGLDAISGSVDKYLDVYVNYFGKITTRLQNSGLTFARITDVYKSATAANPYLKFNDLLTNLNQLVELGIADNVTQRAFFGAISDKVATTFDVAQESMLNIIRIQQKDTTAARLGLEANLTRMLNSYFQDTSYLTNVFDTVQEALIDTSAMFAQPEASIEFEYMVQKWLGSLGSVGVDQSTLTSMAKGINALATGDVDYLSSNAAMQNLLVMSASRAGLSYSQMLSQGVSTSQVNVLMRSVIEYIQGILQSNNNVVKKQYAELFGVTISDLAAFSNLTNSTIENLYNSAITYQNTLDEVSYQLGQVGSRTHISEMINNVLENTMMGIGLGVAASPLGYGMYKGASMLESLTGGTSLPFITAFGTGMDLNMTLEGLVKGGVIGFSALTSLASAIGNLVTGGMLDPNRFAISTSEGRGFTAFAGSGELIQTTSGATTVSNVSSTGISQSLAEQQKAAGTSVTGAEESELTSRDMRQYYDTWTEYMKAIRDELVGGTLSVNVQNAITLEASGPSPQLP